jgi:hypothetical protein
VRLAFRIPDEIPCSDDELLAALSAQLELQCRAVSQAIEKLLGAET